MVIRCFDEHTDLIRRRRYGVIEVVDGQLHGLKFRHWPKFTSLIDVLWFGPRYHARTPGDRCLVFYQQPWRYPNFLALSYVLSSRDCTLASCHTAMRLLDEIARIKRSDAILCDAWNPRISARLMARWGWEAHAPSRWHRNYIKRFYGQYSVPTTPATALAPSC